MKTNIIQNDISRLQSYHSGYNENRKLKDGSVSMYEKNVSTRMNNVSFSGGLPEIGEVAAKTLSKANGFDKFLEWVSKHNIPANAFMALILAGIIRPLTILALPTKKESQKSDKTYAASHAFSSGVIGFAVSYIATIPLGKAITKLFKSSDENGNSGKYGFKIIDEMYEKLNKLKLSQNPDGSMVKAEQKAIKDTLSTLRMWMKNAPDWIIAIPRSMITIALIPVILKMFGISKKGKESEKQLAVASEQTQSITNFRGGTLGQTTMNEFQKGGLK